MSDEPAGNSLRAERGRGADEDRFVTRAGRKLAHALAEFQFDPCGLICADLGSHVGGFVDCLLQHGAGRVYAIDTSYGILAWKLRKDTRVVVMERTNAMHVDLPEQVDLVTIDVGWTPQRRILPRALGMLKPEGRIIALVKPQYESRDSERRSGVVLPECLSAVLGRARGSIRACGATILAESLSPLRGAGGNQEVFFLLSRPR